MSVRTGRVGGGEAGRTEREREGGLFPPNSPHVDLRGQSVPFQRCVLEEGEALLG